MRDKSRLWLVVAYSRPQNASCKRQRTQYPPHGAGRIVQLQKAEDEASVEVYETEEATIFCLPEIEYEIRILYGYFEDGGIEFESSVFGSWGLWFPVEPQDQIRVAADLKHLYKVLEAYEKAIGFIPAEVTFGPQE